MPVSIQARLFAAVGLGLIYNKQDHQVSINATITPSTPAALAGIIASSEPPAAPASADWTFACNTQSMMIATIITSPLGAPGTWRCASTAPLGRP
jgi:hypothetical protein